MSKVDQQPDLLANRFKQTTAFLTVNLEAGADDLVGCLFEDQHGFHG